MARFGFFAASSLIWGGGGGGGGGGGPRGGGKWGFAFPFYSVQDCKSDRFYQIKLEAEAIANESTC